MFRFPHPVKAFLLAIVFPIAVWGQSAPPAETLTLDAAVAMALRENPLLQSATLEVEKSVDRLSAARTQLLPSFELNLLESQPLTRLDFRFPQGVFGTYPGAGPIPAQDTLLGQSRQPTTWLYARAAQPLSQLHRIRLGLQLEQTRGEIEREKLRARRRQTILEVRRIYFQLLGLQSALETSEQNLRLFRELDRVVGAYVVEKVVLKAEGLEARARLAEEEYNSLTLRHGLDSQKEKLNALLGRDIRAEFRLSPLTETAGAEPELKAAQTRALERRPEVMQARLSLQQAELDRRMKKSAYIPDVSLAMTYLRIAPVSLIPPNIASVGVMVAWEPFDWGRKRRELAEKSKSIDQAKLALRSAETQTMLEVNALVRRMQETRSLLRAAELAQEVSREKLRVATNLSDEQAILIKDVLHAQSALAESGQKYQQALLAFWNARAEFENVVGEDWAYDR